MAQDGPAGDSRERLLSLAALAALGEIAAEIAHELGNVLQVVAGSAYAARIEAGRGDAAASLPHIVKLERNAHAAQALVEDVMALARSDALASEHVPFADLVALARRDLPPDSACWEDEVVPADLRVRAHPRLFARLLHALYENALHASTPRVPTISTYARASSGGVVVEVADDGPGVPVGIAPRIFDPLVTARPGGSGLGLALARRIAAAHGGRIALAEGAEGGRGAIFRVELPE